MSLGNVDPERAVMTASKYLMILNTICFFMVMVYKGNLILLVFPINVLLSGLIFMFQRNPDSFVGKINTYKK